MAKPIFTFTDSATKQRYFQVWDTVTGLPYTIPMNLLTFLQYQGIDEKEKVSVWYSIYPRLIETGSSLIDQSFHELPDYLKQQAWDYLELYSDIPTKDEAEINCQLENLFESDKSFFEFFWDYQNLIRRINHFPKRPHSYYFSWSRTSRLLTFSDQRKKKLLQSVVEHHGITSEALDFNSIDIHEWLKKSVFHRYPEAMTDFFVQMAQHNLIASDAIPHMIRNNSAVQELFAAFGMELYTPSVHVDYGIYDCDAPVYETISDTRYLRQLVNLFTFDANGIDLMGSNLMQQSASDLNAMLDEHYYLHIEELANFKNSQGNYLLPMMYTNDFGFSEESPFLFLAPFGQQAYHIFSNKGKVIDDTGYYDFHFVNDSTVYLQNSDSLRWVRWFFDEETQDIFKQDVAIDNPYKEGFWEHEEERFQQSIIEIQENNQPETFEILELEFGTEDDMSSLYLTMLNTPTEEAIRDELKKAFNSLLNRGVNISDAYVAAFEIYKDLLHSNGQMMFSTSSLNYFSLHDNLTDKLETGFKKNYQNDDFAREIHTEIRQYRPIRSHFSLGLFQWRGHYTTSYQYHFQMHDAAEVFQQDCESFINKKPFAAEGDLDAYANEFLSYLLGRNYKQVKAYTQYVGKDSIQELIGLELNPDSNLNYSVQEAVKTNTVDDGYGDLIDDSNLPFGIEFNQERHLNNPVRPANNPNAIDEDDELPF